MKKQFLTTCAIATISLLTVNSSYGQWNSSSPVPVIEADPGYDDIRFLPTTNNNIRSLRGETNNYFEIYSGDNADDGSGLFLYSNGTTAPWGSPGKIALWTTGGISDNNTDIGFEILHYVPDPVSPTYTSLLTLDKDGDITLKNNNTSYNAIKGNSNTYGMVLFGNNNWSDGSGIILNGHSGTPHKGDIAFVATNSVTADGHESAFSYWGNSFTNKLMQINKSGFVGIGTDPSTDLDNMYKLRIKGNIELFNPWGNNWDDRSISANTGLGRLNLFSGTNAEDGSCILLHGDDRSSNDGRGQITFIANADKQGDDNEKAFDFVTFDGGAGTPGATWTTRVAIKNNGKVVIGSDIINNDPNDYKLYVQTGILTEKVKVALSSDYNNWSDFVFDDDYELRPLNEVEAYIKENKHLPEIPSTEEVHANGLDLAQMDAKLLQKIEELTLYIIQQQKEIAELKTKMNK